MNEPFGDDFDNFEEFVEPVPGENRQQEAPWPILFQDAVATAMWRVMNDADEQGLLIEMFNSWDRDKIRQYQQGVTGTYARLGFPEIDYALLDQEIN